MPYHGLLDWRLALDMLDLLRERQPPEARWTTFATPRLGKFCGGNLGFSEERTAEDPAVRGPTRKLAVLPVHPLLSSDEGTVPKPSPRRWTVSRQTG